MKEEIYKRLLQRAAAYCAKAEHSPKEVEHKVTQWHRTMCTKAEERGEEIDDTSSETYAQAIISWLTAEKYLDASRYTERFTSDKIRHLHKGPRLITQELRAKGIEQELIRAQIDSIDFDTWVETAVAYLMPKLHAAAQKSRNLYDLKQRLYATGARRGFGHSHMTEAIAQVITRLEIAEGYFETSEDDEMPEVDSEWYED